MHPRQLELIVGRLLVAIGFEDVAVTKYVGDQGIDVEATLTVGGVTRVRTAIQVKRWKDKNKVGDGVVRELRGSLVTDQRGLIITTSNFTPAAVREAAAPGKVPISLIEGRRLIELLVHHQIGVRRKSVPLLELNVSDLVVAEEEDAGGQKSAALWPLPGGQEHFFETLMAFVDQIGAKKPTLDEMTEWVLANYETVTKQRLVHSYLRAVLYSMGIIDFEGDQLVLTADGEKLRQSRDRADLQRLLELNVLGVTELLEFLRVRPASLPEIHAHLLKKLDLSWNTDAQVRHRLQWLVTCGAVEKAGTQWRLQDERAAA